MPEIQVQVTDGIATVTIDRPARKNALSPALVDELAARFEDLDRDPETRVVVLEGAGGTFSAGGDLGGMNETSPERSFADLVLTIESMDKPTIAKVRGIALGGAVALVAACHFALADEGASFGTPEIRRGLFPFVAMRPILRVVPERRALEMMLLGDRITAERAWEYGLLTRVFTPDALDKEVQALATRLAAGPPTTTAQALRALRHQRTLPEEEALRFLYDELVQCLGTADAAEGIVAFLEKREPVWRKNR